MPHLKGVQIITREEAHRLIPAWPADVSFSSKFANLHSARHSFKSGFVVADYDNTKLVFPIQWGNGSAFSVHKGHTMPYREGTGLENLEWQAIAKEVLKITRCSLYIADFVVPESIAQGLKPLPSAVFILDTSRHDIEQVFAGFNKTTRNLIRRSQEQNFRIEIIRGSIPQQYYDLYVYHQQSMGTPPRAKEYFEQTAQVFGDGFVLIGAYDGEKLVAMNLAWVDDRGLWLSINSSLLEYGSRHVNYLMYYETIRWACEHGIDRIDFGGSPTHHGNIHNVFKLGFGATTTPIYRLTVGTFMARLKDKLARKKRSLQIRINKLWK